VIISYPAPQKFGGGVVTASGANIIHTFNTSGTLSPINSLTASYLIVAGGGAGARRDGAFGGGGGAGGLLSGSGLTLDTNSIYVITVGSGGTTAGDSLAGGSGSNSSFSMVATAAVGGGGGGAAGATAPSGGSGGGGSHILGTGGAGTSGQGNAGGSIISGDKGGGGGGAGAVGGTGVSGGVGGAGTASSITGTSTTYAGGGGGGGNGIDGGAGGAGGGGRGNLANGAALAGTAGTGGGGGGGGYTPSSVGLPGAGGSGIVIISYAGSVQQMAGGTVTISGGNVIHTFTSSGYLTPLKLVNNSLRFRASASAFLSRTFGTPTNQKIWSYSFWFKRGTLGADQLFLGQNVGTNQWYFRLDGGGVGVANTLLIGDYNNTVLTTTPLYRDPAAWYHIVLAYDTTQATATNRVKLYVNGVQQSYTQGASFPAQNSNPPVNQTGLVNNISGSLGYIDGYMTEVRFIDGQQLTPNSFGTFNSYGVWQPITYGGSYGTNGFYLPFTNKTSTTTLGYDFSPNANNWTPNNISLATSTARQVFTSSGTWTAPEGVSSVTYLVVAGGGGTAYGGTGGGGGGAGGYVEGTASVSAGTTYTVTVGGGGTGGVNGSDSVFSIVTAKGGGFVTSNGQNGGSGGGGGNTNGATNFGVSIQTSPAGGTGYGNSGAGKTGGGGYGGGGGGGAGSAGSPSTGSSTGGAGGSGRSSSISGTSVTYAGGGGGWGLSSGASGGSGGGGNGDSGDPGGGGTDGSANTGGGAGGANNFSHNGGSGIVWLSWTAPTSSTYDSMTDVPTLTSATAANYCVLNPLAKNSSLTVQDGNLNCTSASTNVGTSSTIGVSSGKWYWEVTRLAVGGGQPMVGVVKSGWDFTYVGSFAGGYAYDAAGNKYNNETATAYGASYAVGDVVGIALDLTAGTITFYKNNVSQGVAYSGLSGEFFPAFSVQNNTFAANFGQQGFTYTPPSGFVALNTFNL
jgi:hypothetical protein